MKIWGVPRARIKEGRVEIKTWSPLREWLRLRPLPRLRNQMTRHNIYREAELEIWTEGDLEKAKHWIRATSHPAAGGMILRENQTVKEILLTAQYTKQLPMVHHEWVESLRDAGIESEGWVRPRGEEAVIDLHHPSSGSRLMVNWHDQTWQAIMITLRGEQRVQSGEDTDNLLAFAELAERQPKTVKIAPEGWCLPQASRAPCLTPLKTSSLLETEMVLGEGGLKGHTPGSCYTQPSLSRGAEIQPVKTRSWEALMTRATPAGLLHTSSKPLKQRVPDKGKLFYFFRPQSPYR